jgi:hypothetical protein
VITINIALTGVVVTLREKMSFGKTKRAGFRVRRRNSNGSR